MQRVTGSSPVGSIRLRSRPSGYELRRIELACFANRLDILEPFLISHSEGKAAQPAEALAKAGAHSSVG